MTGPSDGIYGMPGIPGGSPKSPMTLGAIENEEGIVWASDIWPFSVRVAHPIRRTDILRITMEELEGYEAPSGDPPIVATIPVRTVRFNSGVLAWSKCFLSQVYADAVRQFDCWIRSETCYRVTVWPDDGVLRATFLVVGAAHPVGWGNSPTTVVVPASEVRRFPGGMREWCLVHATREHDWFIGETPIVGPSHRGGLPTTSPLASAGVDAIGLPGSRP